MDIDTQGFYSIGNDHVKRQTKENDMASSVQYRPMDTQEAGSFASFAPEDQSGSKTPSDILLADDAPENTRPWTQQDHEPLMWLNPKLSFSSKLSKLQLDIAFLFENLRNYKSLSSLITEEHDLKKMQIKVWHLQHALIFYKTSNTSDFLTLCNTCGLKSQLIKNMIDSNPQETIAKNLIDTQQDFQAKRHVQLRALLILGEELKELKQEKAFSGQPCHPKTIHDLIKDSCTSREDWPQNTPLTEGRVILILLILGCRASCINGHWIFPNLVFPDKYAKQATC